MKRITSFLLAMVLFAGLVLSAAPVAYAASEMTVSDALVGVLKKEEGFSAKPYWDHSQYTVGYGTRCPSDMLEEYQKNGISEKEAETLLRNYLSNIENAVNKKFIDKYGLSLSQNQFDALISFTYNIGTTWLNNPDGTFHTAVRKGATGSELIHAFSLWCNAGGSILSGLVRRRLCEANMFLNGEYSIKKPDNYGYVYFDANGGSVTYRIQGYDADEGVAPAYKATRSGHKFQGWYTAKTGGKKVTELTESLSGSTLYARWENTDKEETETVPSKGVSIKVTASDVNLRKGPGTNYTIVGTADKGDKLVITETASGTGYEWGNADGKWIALQFTNYDKVIKEAEKESEETTKETTKETEATEATKPETTAPETTAPETTAPETTEPAPAKIVGKVKANGGLAVRKGPGTGYGKVKYLKNGAKITILEQKKVGSMTWGKISSGWVSMQYVVVEESEVKVPETTKPEETVPETTVPETTEPETTVPETTKPKEEATKQHGRVKADGGLAVRKGPGTGYGLVKYLKNGVTVTVTQQKKADGITWGKIKSGWVSMKFIVLDEKETEAPETTAPETTVPEETVPETTVPKEESTKQHGRVKVGDMLSVRKGAGTSYAIVKYLRNGDTVTITQVKDVKGTKWGKIKSGWVCMDYIVLDNQEETSSNVKTVIADCLNVRKSAKTTAKIVGYYYEGARVEILETKKVDGTTWGKTSKGWISMKYVK